MRKKLLAGLATLSFFFGMTGITNATMITKDFTGSITDISLYGLLIDYSSSISGLQAGDKVNVSYYYDDFNTSTQYDDSLFLSVYINGFGTIASGACFECAYTRFEGTFPNLNFFTEGYTGPRAVLDDPFLFYESVPDAHDYLSANLTSFGGNGKIESGGYFWSDSGDYIGAGSYSIKFDVKPVPEPATLFLFGTGIVGLAISRIKRKKKA